MKPIPPVAKASRLHSSGSGVALIITLAALVLVTMAVVAFFSRATANRLIEYSRANQVQSEQLARTGVDFVSAQFLSDITANSAAVSAGSSTLYRPQSATNMVPARSVCSTLATDGQFANLVRQSLDGDDSSASPAPNGRAITTTAWNAPMLLGGDGFIDASTVPKWIYVKRDGSTSTTGTDSTTIGRFAYNAYNLGGLLDINAFGYGDAFSDANKKTKGSPVSAVLDALPGIEPSPDKQNNSLSWPPTWRIPGDWATVTYNGVGGSTDILKYYSSKGWRIPLKDANGIPIHRFFASRQDLIRYAKANPGTFTLNNGKIATLQYLTHCSRDVDLPTHEPASGRPKVTKNIAAGGNDAYGMDDALNPSLLAVTKIGNTPAITKRFPLSRLALVSTPTPGSNPSNASDIKKYFGLTWDADNNRWKYDHGDLSDILPLSDIPEDRDPDFFELLKAAISVGSLGKQFGIPFPSAYSSLGLPAQKGGIDGSVNYQLTLVSS